MGDGEGVELFKYKQNINIAIKWIIFINDKLS